MEGGWFKEGLIFFFFDYGPLCSLDEIVGFSFVRH